MCVCVYACINLYTIRKYYILPSSVSVSVMYLCRFILFTLHSAIALYPQIHMYIYICTCVHVCRLSLSMRASYVLMNVI